MRVLIFTCLALGALSYPLVNADRQWRERDDLRGATERTSATVVESTHITEINVLPNDVHDDFGLNRHTVPQPYDVVQVELPAAGYPGQVTAVDAVDAVSGLLPGQLVPVAYTRTIPMAHGSKAARARITSRRRSGCTPTSLSSGAASLRSCSWASLCSVGFARDDWLFAPPACEFCVVACPAPAQYRVTI